MREDLKDNKPEDRCPLGELTDEKTWDLWRGGISKLDPNSADGKELRKIVGRTQKIISPTLPRAAAREIVECYAVAILVRRKMEVHLMALGPPDPGADKEGAAQRSAWQTASKTWRTATQQMMDMAERLGIENKPKTEDGEETLQEALDKMKRVGRASSAPAVIEVDYRDAHGQPNPTMLDEDDDSD